MRRGRFFGFLLLLAGVVLVAGGFYPTFVRHRALRRSLIDAVKGGNYAMTELLLDRGADPNTRDAAGVSLASWAMAQEKTEFARLLIERGARSDLRFCALHAAERGDGETLRLLLKHGADPNLRNGMGYSLLMLMAGDAVAAELIARGADVNARAPDGATPLLCAVGNAPALRRLLQAGADPAARDAEGKTPLLHALDNLGPELDVGPVQVLLDAGANPNVRDGKGCTPLILAARQHASQAVIALLKAGADPNARGPAGTTALIEAARVANQYPRSYSPANSDEEAVTALLQHGADPNLRDESGETALLRAADGLNREADAEVLRRLIRGGAEVNARGSDGKTAFIRAASHDGYAAFEPLIRAGADPNAQDHDGRTALIEAVQCGSSDPDYLIRMLLDLGADPSVRDRSGKTARDYARHLSVHSAPVAQTLREAAVRSARRQRMAGRGA